MEELFGGGSRRPSRGADESEKVAAAKIVGRTKKRENRYEKEEDICFSGKDICFSKKDICFSEEDICFSEKDIFFLKRYFSEGERKMEVQQEKRGGFFWLLEGEELFHC